MLASAWPACRCHCWVLLLAVVLGWLTVVLGAAFTQWQLEAQLQAFDLDGDGVFSAAEQTPEQQQAIQAVVQDTARTLAPLTGAVWAPVYVTVLWWLMRLWSGRRRSSAKNLGS